MSNDIAPGGAPERLSWVPLPPTARAVAESLYLRQPATPDELAGRVGLPKRAIARALAHLRAAGLLQGGMPLSDGRAGYVWLDLMPAARRAMAVEVAA